MAWSWMDAARGLAYALPAVVVTPWDPDRGIPLAMGVLPACLLPLAGPRRARVVVLIVGGLCGVSMLLGGALAQLPRGVTALALVAVVVGCAFAASARPAGMILLVLTAPLSAVGLSFDDWSKAVGAAVLMTGGSLYAWLVSLTWPAGPAARKPPHPLPPAHFMLRYGLLLGTGAAAAWLVTSALQLDHPGWAPAACLLVARPDAAMLQLRAVGRAAAVALGALAAVAVLAVNPPAWLLAALTAATISAAAATRTSRWYVTSAFSTFLVVNLLLLDHPEQTSQKVTERIGETLLGVAVALVFGIALPALASRRKQP